MLMNYIVVTFRSLLKNRIYSLINIAGLAIGLACFALIFVYIANERSYDTFNPRGDRVYRVVGVLSEVGLGQYHNAVTQAIMGPTLAADLPQVEATCRLLPSGSMYVSNGATAFYEDRVTYTDPTVFDVLAANLIAGDKHSALLEPHTIVINQEIAQKYFGTENPLGKHLMISGGHGPEPYLVTGVMEKYPKNAHTTFTILISFESVRGVVPWLDNWGTNCLTTYVMLKPGASKAEVDPQITAAVLRHVPQDVGRDRAYYLQPLAEIHAYSGHILYQSNDNQGSASMLRLFGAIALFVLLIASINYMNLATARSLKRAKEVGIRKVLGSDKKDLIGRFLGESVVTALLGFLLSLVLIEVTFPGFTSVLGGRLVHDVHHTMPFYFLLIGVTCLVGLLSGLYPAFVLSAFQPAETLRGRLTRGKGGAALRKGLVFAQFSIAIILLACTAIVRDQMEYIRAKDVGFDKSQLLYVPLRGKETHDHYLAMKNDLEQSPAIQAVSGGGGLAGASGSDGTVTVAGTNGQASCMMRYSPVDYDFFQTLGLTLVQGREFDRRIPSDSATGVILNEAALRELGWKDAIGKQFEQKGSPNLNVIGVVKDYHYFSLYTRLEPQMIYINRENLTHMLVKIAPGQATRGVEEVKKIWERHLNGEPFVYGFVDDAFNRMYRSDQNTHTLFVAFSLVAILVGCLGLFGLSAYTAEQRTKEIGIRKTLGASTSSLILRLSTEFVRLVALSSLVGIPIAYWTMQGWLENFAYRTAISPVSFALAALVVVVIAFVTVSFQAVKVALANPVQSLRYE